MISLISYYKFSLTKYNNKQGNINTLDMLRKTLKLKKNLIQNQPLPIKDIAPKRKFYKKIGNTKQ